MRAHVFVSVALAVLALAALAAAQQPAKPPAMPASFSTAIELVFESFQASFIFREDYDFTGNRVRIMSHGPNGMSDQIWNYATQRHYNISINGYNRSCVVTNSTTDTGRFAVNGPDGVHIMSPSQEFNDNQNLTWVIVADSPVVRGIPCYHWQANQSTWNFNGTVDWYWTPSTWRYQGTNNTMAPVQAISNGVRYARNGSLVNTYRVYNWLNFDPTPPDDSDFQMPEHPFCPELVQIPLPTTPPVFRADIEFSSVTRDFTGRIREMFDYNNNVATIVSEFNFNNPRAFNGSVLNHIDGNTGLDYRVTEDDSGNRVCTVTNRTDPMIRSVYNTTTHHVTHFYPGFFDGYVPTWQYGGIRQMRGIDCDYWETSTDSFVSGGRGPYPNALVSMRQQYYWTSSQWRTYQHDTTIPVAFVIMSRITDPNSGALLNFTYDIYQYIDVNINDPLPSFALEIPRPCPGSPAIPSRSSAGTNKGLVAGLSIAFCIVGVVVGFFAFRAWKLKYPDRYREGYQLQQGLVAPGSLASDGTTPAGVAGAGNANTMTGVAH